VVGDVEGRHPDGPFLHLEVGGVRIEVEPDAEGQQEGRDGGQQRHVARVTGDHVGFAANGDDEGRAQQRQKRDQREDRQIGHCLRLNQPRGTDTR
jgi:hypothetical protein